jgi:hypothetical protein
VVLKILEFNSNYFFAASLAVAAASLAVAAASVAVAAASVAVAAAAVAVVSAAGASSTAGASVTGAASSAGASACLQDTTVNAAITAKLKNTFFILLNYKRLIINSRQRYKFFIM